MQLNIFIHNFEKLDHVTANCNKEKSTGYPPTFPTVCIGLINMTFAVFLFWLKMTRFYFMAPPPTTFHIACLSPKRSL